MKTSIKILLGLLLVIFMIPTLFIMAYSHKVKTGKFKPYNEADHWSRVDLGPGRFIKVTAPNEQLLECTLKLSDKPHYMVWDQGQGGEDSVSISQHADTLFVAYIKSNANDNEHHHRSLELFVNDWQQLQVSGATVNIDSSFGNTDKTINMENSLLKLGIGSNEDEDEDQENGQLMQVAKNALRSFNNLTLNASNSNLLVNNGFSINNLNLSYHAGSIEFKTGAQVQAISGFVSPATKLQVTGAFVSNFKQSTMK